MSRTGWKPVERDAAALFGGKRFEANTGGRLDFETDEWCGQVKNPQRISLATIERLAAEMDVIATAKGKRGVLVVKRSAGKGVRTPLLVIQAVYED